MVSLYPRDTWAGRNHGLRKDLVQWLADLRPAFLRFPGGCIVEGRVLETRYQWKTTIGDPAERKLIVNRWNTEFKHRPAPDCYQSFGLGGVFSGRSLARVCGRMCGWRGRRRPRRIP